MKKEKLVIELLDFEWIIGKRKQAKQKSKGNKKIELMHMIFRLKIRNSHYLKNLWATSKCLDTQIFKHQAL